MLPPTKPPRVHRSRRPLPYSGAHGYEPTREAAMAAFAKRWPEKWFFKIGSPLSGTIRTLSSWSDVLDRRYHPQITRNLSAQIPQSGLYSRCCSR